MPKTPIDLYRQGNANSPRMDHVRDRDLEIYENQGEVWVNASCGGGISTFTTPRNGKNWWKIPQDIPIPQELSLVNDYGNHWLWQPSYDMPISTYKLALQSLEKFFQKFN